MLVLVEGHWKEVKHSRTTEEIWIHRPLAMLMPPLVFRLVVDGKVKFFYEIGSNILQERRTPYNCN